MKKSAIINGTIVDGTGASSFKGNILVENDRIISISSDSSLKDFTKDADEIIDANNHIVAPGFIDSHSHSDLELLIKPILTPKIRQGITTEVLGQDGVAMAPLPIEYIQDWRKNIGGLDGDTDEIDWKFKTVENYLELIRKSGNSSNFTYLVPHGNIRLSVLGFSEKKADVNDIKAMCSEVRLAMEAGCVGLSSGLIYIPCAYGETEELIEMCKVVAEYDGVFVVHQRSEANQILSSMDEIIRIGRESGVRIHFSHFKICGKNNWDKLDEILGKLDSAKAEGITVTFDMYPYTAGSTMLSALLPPWAHIGGTSKMLERLVTPTERAKIKEAVLETNCLWDNFVEFAGFDGIYITSVVTAKNKFAIGKSLSEISDIRGVEPVEVLFDLLVDEENRVGMIDYYGYEKHLEIFSKRDEMTVCTDGLLGGKVHPRAYGAFPRVISEFVHKRKTLTIEEAIERMTSKPANNFNLVNRGILKEGSYADIVIFDLDNFKDMGDFVNPDQYATGLNLVMVNGEVAYRDNQYNPVGQGRVLLRGE